MNTTFLDACMGRRVSRTPVWLMRQAGRYLPQYMEVRSKYSFMELYKTPELAAEVTLQPVDILGVDAAILFSDILTPIETMGMKLSFCPAPVFETPIRSMRDVEGLHMPDMESDLPYVFKTLKLLQGALANRVPLIGFGGAPFTLACYMVEGRGTKEFAQVRRMIYEAPEIFAALMKTITEMSITYLNAQIAAGAQAIQIFDTWGGILSPSDYEKYALPYSRRLISGLVRNGIPIIHFVKGSGGMLDIVKQAGSDVIGLDWHVNLGRARDILGADAAVQGNLDPTVLYAPQHIIETEVQRILDENAGRPGHIFNLGHGILPTIPPDNVKFMVDCVHRLSCRS